MRKLHPTWYTFKTEEKIIDLDIVDSLSWYFNAIEGLSDIMSAASLSDLNSHDSINHLSDLMYNLSKEAEHLVNEWHNQGSNVTPLKAG